MWYNASMELKRCKNQIWQCIGVGALGFGSILVAIILLIIYAEVGVDLNETNPALADLIWILSYVGLTIIFAVFPGVIYFTYIKRGVAHVFENGQKIEGIIAFRLKGAKHLHLALLKDNLIANKFIQLEDDIFWSDKIFWLCPLAAFLLGDKEFVQKTADEIFGKINDSIEKVLIADSLVVINVKVDTCYIEDIRDLQQHPTQEASMKDVVHYRALFCLKEQVLLIHKKILKEEPASAAGIIGRKVRRMIKKLKIA